MRHLALASLLAVAAGSTARAAGPGASGGRAATTAAPTPASPDAVASTAVSRVEPPPKAVPRGAVLEELSGTVREVDRKSHRVAIDTGKERVTLSLDRNTMVYTPAGLGTVLDISAGDRIRAGRNADFLAYWVQLRGAGARAEPASSPGQGTGPAGGSGAPAPERGASAPGGVPGAPVGGPGAAPPGSATPATPGAAPAGG